MQYKNATKQLRQSFGLHKAASPTENIITQHNSLDIAVKVKGRE
jgi:hypothetical protein